MLFILLILTRVGSIRAMKIIPKKVLSTKALREPFQRILALMLNMNKKILHISLLKLIIKRLQKPFLLKLFMAT